MLYKLASFTVYVLYHVGIITLNKSFPHLPISPSPHLPISPSPHLLTLFLIMGIQPDLILLVKHQFLKPPPSRDKQF